MIVRHVGPRQLAWIGVLIGIATSALAQSRVWPPPRDELIGHLYPVTALSFAPDGRSLASGSEDGAVKIWDIAAHRERFVMRGHPQAEDGTFGRPGSTITSLCFSRSGGKLASADINGTIKLWDAATGRVSDTLKGHEGSVTCVVFDPAGRQLASAGYDGTVKLWDVGLNRAGPVFTGPESAGHVRGVWMNSLAFASDGQTLAAGRQDGSILIWNTDTEMRAAYLIADEDKAGIARAEAYNRNMNAGRMARHDNSVVALAYARDGKTLAALTTDKMVRLWDTSTSQVRAVLKGDQSERHAPPAPNLVFSRDGTRVISLGGDGVVRSWDTASGDRRGELTTGRHHPRAMALAADESVLALVAQNRIITLWDARALFAPPHDK